MEIRLDKIRYEDLELLRQWRMSKGVTQYMITHPVITSEQQIAWYQSICNECDGYYWVIKCNEISIGYISITNIDRENSSCEVGHYIGDMNYRRRGISKIVETNIYDFVFQEIKLDKIHFIMLEDNKVAYKLHQSLGAVEWALETKECVKDNQSYTLVGLCMTKEIWQNTRKNIDYPKINIAVDEIQYEIDKTISHECNSEDGR